MPGPVGGPEVPAPEIAQVHPQDLARPLALGVELLDHQIVEEGAALCQVGGNEREVSHLDPGIADR